MMERVGGAYNYRRRPMRALPGGKPVIRPAAERERRQLRKLVNELPEQFLSSARELLEDLIADDEPLTPEDIAAIEEGRRDMEAGRVYTHEEAMRELGLS